MLNSSPIAYNRIVAYAGGIPWVDTTDYTVLRNKPSIEGVTLNGNKTFVQLGLIPLTNAEIDTLAGLTASNVITVYGDIQDVRVNNLSVVDSTTKIANIDLTSYATSASVTTAISTAISSLSSLKQDKLIAGSNITIAQDGKTISAVNTVYDDTALSARVTSVEGSINSLSTTVQGKQDELTQGTNITIASDGTISATDTTYSPFVGCTTTVNGSVGLVPAPSAGTNNKFLRNDGVWAIPAGGGSGSTVTITPSLSTGTKIADYEIDGVAGELYAPSGGGGGGSTVAINRKVNSGENFADISIDGVITSLYATNTTYSAFVGAQASVDGSSGLVPTPQAGDNSKYLCGDGTWKTISVNNNTQALAYKELTPTQYNNLSSAEKNNGVIYFVNDNATGAEGLTVICISQSDYNNLSYAEKHNNIPYFVY